MAAHRPVVAAVVGTLLLVGCTGGPEEGTGAAKSSGARKSTAGEPGSGPSSSAASEDTGPYTVAQDRAPGTRAEAVEFVRGIAVRPDYFGVGFRKSEPYESDPAQWTAGGPCRSSRPTPAPVPLGWPPPMCRAPRSPR